MGGRRFKVRRSYGEKTVLRTCRMIDMNACNRMNVVDEGIHL